MLRERCSSVDLRRYDMSAGALDAIFSVDIDGRERLAEMQADITNIDANSSISFLDTRDEGAL